MIEIQTNSQQILQLDKRNQKLRNSYLDLMENCLIGLIYKDISCGFSSHFDEETRITGRDWPSQAHSMIGKMRMRNIRDLLNQIIADNVQGDLIETGVWRGGACIYMRAILKAWAITDRKVWVADSFQGVPEPDSEHFPQDSNETFHTYTELAVSSEEVTANFQRYGLLDEQVVFLKGFFKDTLHKADISELALLRLDGDLYESTIQALTALYPKLSYDGYVIIDDYHCVDACKQAVEDYCQQEKISPDLQEIDGIGVYWKKQA